MKLTPAILILVLAVGCQPTPTETTVIKTGQSAQPTENKTTIINQGGTQSGSKDSTAKSGVKDSTKINVNTNTSDTNTDTHGTATNTDTNTSLSWDERGPSELELGVPFYPGSKPQNPAGAKVESPEKTTITANRSTADTVEKVVAFYKSKLATVDNSTADNTIGTGALVGKTSDEMLVNVQVVADPDKKETMVSVTVDHPKK